MKKRFFTVVLMLALAVMAMGCQKGADAFDVATKFNEDLAGTKGYIMSHTYVEDGETMVVTKDASGNVRMVYTYADGMEEEFYKIGEEAAYYLDGEQTDEIYTLEEIDDMIDFAIEDALFYPNDSMEVFDTEIDSTIGEDNDKKAFAAFGDYDDGTPYAYYYGKDGTFFELIDQYDVIRIDLDDSVTVTMP